MQRDSFRHMLGCTVNLVVGGEWEIRKGGAMWLTLKTMTVGILRMPYSVATPGLSSVFSFTCRTQSCIQEI